jgi:hypothetical protein
MDGSSETAEHIHEHGTAAQTHAHWAGCGRKRYAGVFSCAHLSLLMAIDFFTNAVCTGERLMTHSALFSHAPFACRPYGPVDEVSVHGAMGLPTSSPSHARSGVNPWTPTGDPSGVRNRASVSMSCLELTPFGRAS